MSAFVISVCAGTVIQAITTRKRIDKNLQVPKCMCHEHIDGELRIIMLGDSLAAGLGTQCISETPGILISNHFKQYYNIDYKNFAQVGATSIDLYNQVLKCISYDPDIVFIVIGTNDITHLKPIYKTAPYLKQCVKMLTTAGIETVVITTPNILYVTSIHIPLRFVLGILSIIYSRIQSYIVHSAGGKTISLNTKLNKSMFSIDQYHPNPAGYKYISNLILNTYKDY